MTAHHIKEQLLDATKRLTPHSDSARLDAELLLSHVLTKPRSHLYAWPEQTLSNEQTQQYKQLLSQRQQGMPIAYLTGEHEFWSLPLQVSAATLIPRPETERLVEQALQHIPLQQPWQIADLGTGSGAIALAIAHERPDCHIIAVDQSNEALQVARNNAAQLGIANILFHHGDWLQGLTTFDIIISNPPYIRADDPHLQQLQFEPQTALVADQNGMAALYNISQQARQHLRPNGWLLLEHGFDQRHAICEYLQQLGYNNIDSFKDLSGNDRITQAQI